MKFGLELEFTAGLQHAAGDIGSFYDYYRQLLIESGIHGWNIHQDNSCGNEIVSPPLNGEEGLKLAMQACYCADVAKRHFGLKRILGPDCGVHFHFDAAGMSVRDLRNVLVIMSVLETLFYAMNPISRFDTAFAAPLNFNLHQVIRARDLIDLRNEWFRPYMGVHGGPDSHRHRKNNYLPEFINQDKKAPDKYDWTRYHGLNFVAYLKLGTIEFRYTHGTFNGDILERWYYIYKSVMQAARTMMTQKILAIYPIRSRERIITHSLGKLQYEMYSDLRRVIKFFIKLTKPDVKTLKFIVERLFKFSPECIRTDVYKFVMEYDGENVDKLKSVILTYPIRHKAGSMVMRYEPAAMQ